MLRSFSTPSNELQGVFIKYFSILLNNYKYIFKFPHEFGGNSAGTGADQPKSPVGDPCPSLLMSGLHHLRNGDEIVGDGVVLQEDYNEAEFTDDEENGHVYTDFE